MQGQNDLHDLSAYGIATGRECVRCGFWWDIAWTTVDTGLHADFFRLI